VGSERVQPPVDDDYPNSWRSEALRHDVIKKILLIGGICLAFAIGAVVCLFVACFCILGKRRGASAPIARGAALGEMGTLASSRCCLLSRRPS